MKASPRQMDLLVLVSPCCRVFLHRPVVDITALSMIHLAMR